MLGKPNPVMTNFITSDRWMRARLFGEMHTPPFLAASLNLIHHNKTKNKLTILCPGFELWTQNKQ